MVYTLYSNGVLEQDGFYLPIDEYNPDFIAYQEWLAEGNTPILRPASEYLTKLTDEQSTRVQLRSDYIGAIQDLQTIIDTPAPATQTAFNTWAFQALKTIARILRVMLKLAARRWL